MSKNEISTYRSSSDHSASGQSTSDNSTDFDADVAIVGGGMVGLSLALMFAQREVARKVLVFDARAFNKKPATEFSDQEQLSDTEHQQPSFDGRSTAVSAGTADILRSLGLWADIAPGAEAITEVKVSDKGHAGASAYRDPSHASLGYVVENRQLGIALKTAVNNDSRISVVAPAVVENLKSIRGGMSFTASEQDASGASTLQKRTRLLILADGAGSDLAASVGVQFDQRDYQQFALVCNVEHEKPHEGMAFEHFTEAGPVAFLPLTSVNGRNRSAVVWTHSAHSSEPHSAKSTAQNKENPDYTTCDSSEFLSTLQARFGHRLGKLLSVGKRSSYPLKLVLAQEQVRSHLVLMGNAAHFLHPVAGQGFNLALRDNAVLVNELKAGLAAGRQLGDLKDLQRYVEKRELDQWLTTELGHSFIRFFMDSGITKRGARTVGLGVMNKVAPLKSLFFQQMMGQGVNKVVLK